MLGFQCDCSCHDYDPASVYSEHTVRARKPHECCECGETIPVGAPHEHVTGCWDGNWSVYRTCGSCVSIREHFCPGGWIFGELAEQVRECLGFDYRDDPATWDQAEVDEEDEDNRRWLAQRKTADTVAPEADHG